MTRSIQSLAAQAGREARTNGLPCGEHVYSDPLKIENRYQSEADCIREKYGSIANWRAWDNVLVKERATGATVFDNELAKITGKSLHATPAEVLAVLDPSIYEVK
jgi:hypothetical protein